MHLRHRSCSQASVQAAQEVQVCLQQAGMRGNHTHSLPNALVGQMGKVWWQMHTVARAAVWVEHQRNSRSQCRS